MLTNVVIIKNKFLNFDTIQKVVFKKQTFWYICFISLLKIDFITFHTLNCLK